MTLNKDDRDSLVSRLRDLADEELLGVLQRVFTGRTLLGTEVPIVESHFFLGNATRLYENTPDGGQAWEPWEIHAIAYPDLAAYDADPDWFGFDYGFSEWAICSTCGIELKCNVKHGICPVCSTKAYLT